MVEVAIQCRNSETLYLKTIVTEKICSALQGQMINLAKDQFEHLNGLPLADKNDGRPLEIEVLNGLDNYWRIVTGEVIKGAKGPVAMSTKLGYILSGPSKDATTMFVNQPSINLMASCLFVEDTQSLDAEMKKF